GLGTGGSLVMAYCKPPSLVWKPKDGKKVDVIKTQLKKLRVVRASSQPKPSDVSASFQPKPGDGGASSRGKEGLEELFAENLGVVDKATTKPKTKKRRRSRSREGVSAPVSKEMEWEDGPG